MVRTPASNTIYVPCIPQNELSDGYHRDRAREQQRIGEHHGQNRHCRRRRLRWRRTRSTSVKSPSALRRATPHLLQIQHVAHTSYCDIGFELAKDGKRLVLVSCLDNLLKGAAGQAVQNMNLMFGFGEAEGLL